MKKAQIIIYTRNRDVDYRMVVAPDENLCPPETRKYFRQLIRGAIDVETYDDPLDTPRWLFARKDNTILFGVATMLEKFGTEFCTDFTGRSVRGFFGIVMDGATGQTKLPYSIDYFREINLRLIEPLWEASKEDFIRKGIEADIDEKEGEILAEGDESSVLNTDRDVCLLLGNKDIKAALQTALGQNKDISLITGLNSRNHAIASESDYDFMNAFINGISETETVNKRTKQVQKTPNIVSTEPLESKKKPKKASRLKIALTLLSVAAAVIVILLLTKTCTTTQTSHNSSTSGDTDSICHQDTILKKN